MSSLFLYDAPNTIAINGGKKREERQDRLRHKIFWICVWSSALLDAAVSARVKICARLVKCLNEPACKLMKGKYAKIGRYAARGGLS